MNIKRHLLKRILQEIWDKIFENWPYKICGQQHLKKLGWYSLLVRWNIWVKVFKIGPRKICGRQPLRNIKRYGLPKLVFPEKKLRDFFSVIFKAIPLNLIKIELHYKGLLGNISEIWREFSNHSFFGASLKSYFNEFLGINPKITLGDILSLQITL